MAKIDLCYKLIDWEKRKPSQSDEDAPKKDAYPTLNLPDSIKGLEKLQPGKHTLTFEVNIDKNTEEDSDGEKSISIDMDVLSVEVPDNLKSNTKGMDDSDDEVEEGLKVSEANSKAYPKDDKEESDDESED